MCRRTIYDARNNFSALVKLAESGESVELTRHDKPVADLVATGTKAATGSSPAPAITDHSEMSGFLF